MQSGAPCTSYVDLQSDPDACVLAGNVDCPALSIAAEATTVVGHCEAYVRAKMALHTFQKYDQFRPGQLYTLMAVLHGKDAFVRMATGAGKTLCFILAPLSISIHAVAVVISPLNGLMEQQVYIYISA